MTLQSLSRDKISTKRKISLIIFGLLLCVLLLEAGLRIGGFVYLFLQEHRNRISLKQKGVYRIMCLGESTTASGGKDSYPRQVEEILNQQDMGIRFSVINKGIPGIKTAGIRAQLEDNLNKYNPDMVTTMMGINDRRDAIVYYEDIPVEKTTLFLKSFRTYKLIKLPQLHIVNKAREVGIYKSKENITNQANDSTPSPIYNDRERLAKEPKETTPDNYQAYIKLGRWYNESGDYDKAKEMFKKAIEINLRNDEAYAGLGWCYNESGKYVKAEEILKKAIEINPRNEEAYAGLGWCYHESGKYVKAEEMLKKAIEINPRNDWAYAELGWCYSDQEDYDKAEEMFKKAIEINPRENEGVYAELGWCYRLKGDYAKAEEMYKRAIEINPGNDRLYGALARCYQGSGKHKLAEEYFRKANKIRSKYYNTVTHRNYQRLKEILTEKGIKLVCVQYPMRSVEPLKKMLKPHEGIIFVDNEGIFKNAVRQTSYDEYFGDMFGGDFGHCTRKGNRLLAENIANIILKECFNEWTK